jgi:hypothetical protein
MILQVKVREGEVPVTVTDVSELDRVLQAASEEARAHKMMGAILIEAESGNVITMVVGGEETVLSFDSEHLNPPYYASRGKSDCDEPKLTCYTQFHHHSEFSRKYVIPLEDGVRAVRQFLYSGDLPTCIKWDEV